MTGEPAPTAGQTGRSHFIARHGLYSETTAQQAQALGDRLKKDDIETVRISFADQHGILRGKALTAAAAAGSLRDGCAMTSSLLAKDTSHRTVFDVFAINAGTLQQPEMRGAGDLIMVPDPSSYRQLPWLPRTAWLLADIYFANGQPVPYATREICKRQLARLQDKGYGFIGGIELEFHLFRLTDPKLQPGDAAMSATPPEVSLLSRGYQYLTETRLDEMEPIVGLLQRNLTALGLPLRSMEVEFGPSQCELTFFPQPGLELADGVVLLRSAIKQIARRNGYLASFMCRPALPNLLSCGWHLHQSLVDTETGANLFMPAENTSHDLTFLSPKGQHFLGGLIAHAAASTAFSTPTINGYKRYQPYSLAPDRIAWGLDNKGAMLRVIGGADDPATRLENRLGEPAANPYLYVAAQIAAGLDGIENLTSPGSPIDAPYSQPAPKLPSTLAEAIAALSASSLYRSVFGDTFIDYYCALKTAEIKRFDATVTDWEHREYFENA